MRTQTTAWDVRLPFVIVRVLRVLTAFEESSRTYFLISHFSFFKPIPRFTFYILHFTFLLQLFNFYIPEIDRGAGMFALEPDMTMQRKGCHGIG